MGRDNKRRNSNSQKFEDGYEMNKLRKLDSYDRNKNRKQNKINLNKIDIDIEVNDDDFFDEDYDNEDNQ